MAIKPEIMEFITTHADAVVSEAKTILATVTNKDVELTFEEAIEFDFEVLSSTFAESVVEVSFSLASDPEGLVQLFFEKSVAARIGSLMMMMDEESPEFSEEHVDAMQETVNQVLGAIATSMTEKLGFSLSFDKLKGEETELSEESFSLPELLASKFSLSIAGADASSVIGVVTSSSIESVMSAGSTDEPAGAAEEATEAEAGEGEAAEETEEAEQDELSADELAEIGSALGADIDIDGEGDAESVDAMLAGGPVDGVEDFTHETPATHAVSAAAQEEEPKITFLMDLKFPVSIELGRTKMLIKDILELGHGSVIEFDKLANEPVDLLIDEKKIAEGEVVVIDEHFGIRLTNLIHTAEWLKEMSKKHQ